MPNLYIIAGCNGAGKTTASLTILPDVLQCNEFVNADSIAKGLSPFNEEAVAFEAGRIMLNRIQELLHKKTDFAIETTLASKSYASLIRQAKKSGYEVHLIFFWLNSVELAKERVQQRVLNGGHNIDKAVIERRYKAGLQNFNKIFCNLVDNWFIYDNSNNETEPIAEKIKGFDLKIFNIEKYKRIENEN
ncbi:MAG: zeta toxin family protein [Bacteroidetes bacterium]|nr:zeta toxin family protein [Bacteroidota bacterium]